MKKKLKEENSADNLKSVDPRKRLHLEAKDSGLSIDNVLELKALFNLILETKSHDCNLYIVIAANEYELANGMNCMDVMTGKHITFKDYDDYKSFIVKSRKKKEERIQKAREKQKNENK